MKEKTTAILTLGCIFSLFFYYKIYSPNQLQPAMIESVATESVIDKLVEKVEKNENESVENAISKSSDNAEKSSQSVQCSLIQNEIDSMTFSESFKYHRDCNGKGTLFTWKNNEYSTFLASEKVEEMKNESNVVEKSLKVTKDVDKFHLDFQKAVLGTTVGNNK